MSIFKRKQKGYSTGFDLSETSWTPDRSAAAESLWQEARQKFVAGGEPWEFRVATERWLSAQPAAIIHPAVDLVFRVAHAYADRAEVGASK